VDVISSTADDRSSHPVRSLADVAWIEIREKILTGALPPGAPVGLKEQAEVLGLSIMPVRDAVNRLKHEGLIVQVPQREAFVSPISLDDMEEIYAIRGALEGLAVERTCKFFTAADYGRLSDTLEAFATAYESGNFRGGRELHRRFHLDLYAVGSSPTLNRLIPPLIDQTERYRALSQSLRGPVKQRRQEHQAILDACLSRDGERARALLIEHLYRTIDDVRKVLHAKDAGLEPKIT